MDEISGEGIELTLEDVTREKTSVWESSWKNLTGKFNTKRRVNISIAETILKKEFIKMLEVTENEDKTA